MKISKTLFKKKLPQSGIYCIENLVNGKLYIGSSKNLYQRLHEHRCSLNGKYHQNIKLQRSWTKHTEFNFTYHILEFCDFEILTIREQYYIDTLNPVYNICKLVIRNNPSEESKEKISNSLKLGYLNGTIKAGRSQPIKVYDINNNYIRTFDTLKECSKVMNTSMSSICRVLNGVHKQSNGYRFLRIQDDENFDKLILNNAGKPKKKTYLSNSRSKELHILNIITNKLYIFNGMKEMSIKLNIKYELVRQFVTTSKLKIYKNTYKLLPVPVKQGELLETPTTVIVNEDNQQPSLSSNTFEGSTTNSQIQTSNVEDSNADTSALHYINSDDIV
jgi:hypothetical protein